MPTHYENGVFPHWHFCSGPFAMKSGWSLGMDVSGHLWVPGLLLHSPWEKLLHLLIVFLYEAWPIAFVPATVYL